MSSVQSMPDKTIVQHFLTKQQRTPTLFRLLVPQPQIQHTHSPGNFPGLERGIRRSPFSRPFWQKEALQDSFSSRWSLLPPLIMGGSHHTECTSVFLKHVFCHNISTCCNNTLNISFDAKFEVLCCF